MSSALEPVDRPAKRERYPWFWRIGACVAKGPRVEEVGLQSPDRRSARSADGVLTGGLLRYANLGYEDPIDERASPRQLLAPCGS